MKNLKEKAKQIRLDIIDLSNKYENGHIASAYSCVEILVALYYKIMSENDQFILSKGHGVLALYAILIDKGYKPEISGHPDIEIKQGIMCTTGSLGHGLPIAAGKAFARKIKNENDKIYVLIGDGECQEGSIWETLNLIRKFHLNNLIIILDYNKYQALDTVEEILDETNLKEKFEAFGMNVLECNGHDLEAISNQLSVISLEDKPTIIIAHTVKGKGISFMENIPCWHSRMLNEEEEKIALKEVKS